MKYLLDTNVFRELGKTVPHEHVGAWLDTIDDAELAISALTVREVAKGVTKLAFSKPGVADQIATRTSAIFDALEGRILSVDRQVARVWGEALAQSEKHVDDTGFAATALVHGLILVTRNTKDLAWRGVQILNPYKSPPERLSAK
ncbi:type II toxin-antitoxin system VapC family toxin [Labrys wisconsinensis]|uniref:Nucleic acid-binding protein n=1 Tax=Labrys wisconsinensis TaxID=425677 RepID=A0ABU0JEA6_9HYPH|nr:type II toxin-antitoxin system VapC family toxin [Labrys wisconsinensis]MDQ0471614.1 putative nucleic acid-binding protein [Labrys wisconsinensis]